MAVAQGYGKTVTSGSVFAYDVADTRNSYIGEPTTNLIPNPTVNSYPTYGNGWGTYNTNQYCGNNGCGTYWDIPAIASVSNNIITTVSDHPIRSFDVINPQTTGGGVTAGTQYFAKKISNTQFSLHAYNGSQDGSQGYTNPTTGHFKVHDSFWLDERVSVNSSSFPTRWFGNPHQPNSALVKEIIPGGFTQPNGTKTDCMRLHFFRSDATDGMAYGVDTSFTPNQDTTISFSMRAVSTTAVGNSIYVENYTYGTVSPTYRGASKVIGPVGVWQKHSNTWNSPNSVAITYFFPSSGNMVVDIANIQIEQKNHSTPFVAGTRSATQGLLPLVGNTSLDLSTVSFDSNAQMTFDGTNDDIRATISNSKTNVTMEGIFYVNQWTTGVFLNNGDDPGGYCIGIGQYYNTTDNQIVALFGYIRFILTGAYYEYTGYHHIVMTLDASSTPSIYVNGKLIGTYPGTAPNTPSAGTGFSVGSQWGIRYANTKCPVSRFYNRELSAAEVKQNYLHYKTRFNLS